MSGPANEKEHQKDAELKELERQKDFAKARSELLAEQRKLDGLLDPEKSASRTRLEDLETRQKELEAVKKLFPGGELTVSDAAMTLADTAYIDNEIDGAAVAQELANQAANEIRAYKPDLAKVVILDAPTAELFAAYRNVDAQLGLAVQMFGAVREKAQELLNAPAKAGALSGFETAGIALALLSTIGKSVASIAQLFKVSREVKNPVALAQFTRELELALYGNLVAGHAPGCRPATHPRKIQVVVPAVLALGTAPALGDSRILRSREGARGARDEAEKQLRRLEEKTASLTEARLQARVGDLRADFDRAVRLLGHIEDLLFGNAPGAKPVLDGLLVVDQLYQDVQDGKVPLLFVQGLAAGARNEVRKSLWRSPKWSRSAGGVVGLALYGNDGNLLWARVFSRQSGGT
jgi:hypothetical protein